MFLTMVESKNSVSHNAQRTVNISSYKASRYVIIVILFLFPLSSKCSPRKIYLKDAQFSLIIRSQTFLSQNVYI
jgi:hypothetical protein